jgi:putative acetyltransferase
MTITFAPLRPDQIAEAKLVLATVAFPIFKETETLQEYIDLIEAGHYLKDVENFQQSYNENGGTFLVAMDDGRVIGTAALRRIDAATGELRRMWLLLEYHGQKIGYRLVQEIFAEARRRGYRRIWLQTNHIQAEAVAFYTKLGFHEIPNYQPENDDDLSLELLL